MQLYEQYRPQDWGDVVGQDAAIHRLEVLSRRGLGGRAYWINGLSGTGKTTIAKLLAAEVADEWATWEVDAKGLTAKGIQELEARAASPMLGEKHGVAIIINEAHGLSDPAVKQLLCTLDVDRIPQHAMWIFTTTLAGQLDLFEGQYDAHPFLSRCQEIKLETRGLELAFALLCRQIAQTENLDGQSIDAYVSLARRCKCNMRAMLQEIEGGSLLVG
jgi:DNA polymerase III gamma/tau subunit